jgi:small ligand-binding sensory domain FIST
VRHLIGFDPARRGLAIADHAVVGQHLSFCTRNPQAAQRDLVRICTEIRDQLEPETLPLATAQALLSDEASSAPAGSTQIAGAVYISCAGRGGPHFGAPSAELATVRRALGDVPLVGFFAAGEVARHHLYGYTGVLTVFTR